MRDDTCTRPMISDDTYGGVRHGEVSIIAGKSHVDKSRFTTFRKYPEGLTVRELKLLVANLPEVDAYGDEYEVWLDHGDGTSSGVKAVWPLNVRNDGCDILFTAKQ